METMFVRAITHFSHETTEILFHNKCKEVVTSLLVSCNIPYGRQDTDYIISSISLVGDELALESEAIGSVEQVLFSKYMMYRSLYWHKGVRSATAMIKKAVLTALRDGVITFDDLYLKDDYEFYSLQERYRDYGPFSLIRDVERGRLLERKAELALRDGRTLCQEAMDVKTRHLAEERVRAFLLGRYPDLKPEDVIIDIPEPISFETHIRILRPDGTLSDAEREGMVFQKAGNLFSQALRKASLFLPGYVDEGDADRAFREAVDGE